MPTITTTGTTPSVALTNASSIPTGAQGSRPRGQSAASTSMDPRTAALTTAGMTLRRYRITTDLSVKRIKVQTSNVMRDREGKHQLYNVHGAWFQHWISRDGWLRRPVSIFSCYVMQSRTVTLEAAFTKCLMQ
jgi:hypothetical protein